MDIKLPPQNSTRIFQMLINVMPYIFWKDNNGIYQGGNWNEFTNLGFSSSSEFIGKSIFEILEDQEAAKKIDDIDKAVMQEKKAVKIEEEISFFDGKKVYLSHKYPIFNNDKNVIGLLGFSVDITEIKQQCELLKQLNNKILDDVKLELFNLEKIIDSSQMSKNEQNSLKKIAISLQRIISQSEF